MYITGRVQATADMKDPRDPAVRCLCLVRYPLFRSSPRIQSGSRRMSRIA